MTCIQPGCRRTARPDYSRCEAHIAALYRRMGWA